MNIKGLVANHWFKFIVVILLGLVLMTVNNYLKAKTELANREYYAQQELKQKEFAAQQKESCLAIYKQESSKWNNVSGWRYEVDGDTCYVQYKESQKKTAAQCEEEYSGLDGKLMSSFMVEYLLCLEGIFEKSY